MSTPSGDAWKFSNAVHNAAIAVGGTEAAAFSVTTPANKLQVLLHIRPDDSNADQRARAVAAFAQLIELCVSQGRDGAIEVCDSSKDGTSQFCLICLIRAKTEVCGAIAIITRCKNVDEAQSRLMHAQRVVPQF